MTLRLAITFPIVDSNLLSSSLLEDDHPVWDAGVAYAEFDQVMKGHVRYEALQASTGEDPALDVQKLYWLPLGATNRWRAFDKFISDPVIGVAGEAIQYQLGQIGEPVSVVSCFGLSATEVTLKGTLPDNRVIYDKTISLRDNTMIIDAWTYCFEPIRARSEAVFNEIPPYTQATYELTISAGGDTPKVGQIVLGREYDMGEAKFGTSFGIEDYSSVQRDDFGSLSIVERPFSKIVDYRCVLPADHGRRVAIVLEENRARPVVVFGGNDSDVIGVTSYGKLGDWRVDTIDPIDSELKLKVEGLT
ncbi:hypothetical protein PXK30_05325 [Phaeobacter gallaeciensis]|uniref:hypothetical protein n=1 Tax=Phaeobacter gallaeciensis TaxID=60890 RepID=UPI00237F59F5|nr:hypothetical protein [Phaeobacter gallaeciensis]MDE4302847.1 hypothetical protein [Phaeobacter gallaeciensis]MDE4307060.1 hypothetical protein [Phaeobacter gallaeciensis]MDE4311525.1 hypothetical protein [Phaeobacter gallaeciensis]MDE4316168.1 hypothetical protein [Phaeobacter gallaeciensis]MDE4320452.1 hypothetical protein [Phaeobacter gallaeciensis]